MDMSFATIPIFGQKRMLYRENLLEYMVRIKYKPNNHPVYYVETDIGSSIFYNNLCLEGIVKVFWKMQKQRRNCSKKNSFWIRNWMMNMEYGIWILMGLFI